MESKNAKRQNKDEKLSDEEFKDLIPHIDLKELFLIELQKEGVWKNLFDACFIGHNKIKHIYCAACLQDIPLIQFKDHTQAESHLDALNKVERFYHPLFTSNRGTKSDLFDFKQKEVNVRKANAIAAIVYNAGASNGDKSSSENASWTTITVSLEDLLSVEFQQKKDGKWQKMLTPHGRATEKSKYECNLCRRKFCVGIITVNAHLRGGAHRQTQDAAFDVRLTQNAQVNKNTILAANVDNVQKGEADVQEGLIGVEYVARIQKNNGEYSYSCCLCKYQIFDTEVLMENHLISLQHRRKYCKMHYSDTTKYFEEMVKLSGLSYEVGMTFIFSKIANGIENYHSYGKPHETVYDYFMENKKNISELVAGLPHACQDFGPSYSAVVNMKDLFALKKKPNAHASRCVTTTKARFMVPPKKYYLNMKRHVSRVVQMSEDIEKQQSVSSHRLAEKAHNNRGYYNSGTVSGSISPHLHHSRKRRLSPAGEGADVWRTYRHRISESASGLEQAYLHYRQQPEKHPNYDKEWSMFWKRRKLELHQEGRDYRSYDFQPEWTTYFRQRLDQLLGEELQNLKIKVRRELNIPLDAEEDSRFVPAERSFDPPRKRELSEKRHLDDADSRAMVSESREEPKMWNPPAPLERERPNIIGLLRLMTALDDHLGSIGDKILDLLKKALSLEKMYPADSSQLEQRILNANNCQLLKSAQEKLKSQLYADLVESRKINSFNRVIESAEVLLNRADAMGWSTVEEPSSAPPTSMQIEKLFEVLQEKTKNDYPVAKKKSLPDTLMDIMSQKKGNSQTTDHIRVTNQIDQGNYGFGNDSATLSYPDGLSKQNSALFTPSSFSGETFRGNLGASKPNLTRFQALENNSGVWNRLGGQTNYAQRNSQAVLGNFGGPRPPAAGAFSRPNPYANRNVIGGNNSFSSSNAGGNNTFGGPRFAGNNNAYNRGNNANGGRNVSGNSNPYGGGGNASGSSNFNTFGY